MIDHEGYEARKRLGLFEVTMQSAFFEWLWAMGEIRKHEGNHHGQEQQETGETGTGGTGQP